MFESGDKMSKKINNVDEGITLFNLFKFIVIVVVAFVAFYGITVLVTNKKESKKEDTKVDIQYDEILVGEILNRNIESYYVLVVDGDLDSYYQYVGSDNNANKVYYCDLSNSFNKPYLSDESNLFVSNIGEIKFSKTTLLNIESNKIVNAYEDADEILNILDSNSKQDSE